MTTTTPTTTTANGNNNTVPIDLAVYESPIYTGRSALKPPKTLYQKRSEAAQRCLKLLSASVDDLEDMDDADKERAIEGFKHSTRLAAAARNLQVEEPHIDLFLCLDSKPGAAAKLSFMDRRVLCLQLQDAFEEDIQALSQESALVVLAPKLLFGDALPGGGVCADDALQPHFASCEAELKKRKARTAEAAEALRLAQEAEAESEARLRTVHAAHGKLRAMSKEAMHYRNMATRAEKTFASSRLSSWRARKAEDAEHDKEAEEGKAPAAKRSCPAMKYSLF